MKVFDMGKNLAKYEPVTVKPFPPPDHSFLDAMEAIEERLEAAKQSYACWRWPDQSFSLLPIRLLRKDHEEHAS